MRIKITSLLKGCCFIHFLRLFDPNSLMHSISFTPFNAYRKIAGQMTL